MPPDFSRIAAAETVMACGADAGISRLAILLISADAQAERISLCVFQRRVTRYMPR